MKTKLLKKKDIIELTEEAFKEVLEAGIDTDNNMISGVCLFGTDISKNGRKYESRAIDSLTTLSEGVKCFINHPTKSDVKERAGVRNLSEWVGVFSNARREGNKVFADLKCREAYFDLVKDIALLQPRNVGNSINAMVKVAQAEDGMESVINVERLRSVDLVSSAATCVSLFESAIEKATKDIDNEEENILSAYESTVPYIVKEKFETIIVEEGLIQDKLDNEKLQQEISMVTYLANDLIRDTIYNSKLNIEERKKKVVDIFDDLSKEIKKRVSKLKTNVEEDLQEMDITLAMVKENKSIMEAILDELKDELSVKETLEEVVALKESITNLEKSIEDKDEEIITLKTENETAISEKDEVIKEKDESIATLESEKKEFALKLDEIAVIEFRNEKKVLVNKIISESDLPKEAVTELFTDTLMALEADTDSEGEITKSVEEKVKEYIEDRMVGIAGKKEKKKDIKGAGDEFIDKTESEDKKPLTKDELKDAKENFIHESR